MPDTSSVPSSLFSRDRVSPRRRDRWTQTDYQRLDQATGAVADRVRWLMDEWYAALPSHAEPEIWQRFASPSPGAHLGAFWEMYLHEALRRLELGVALDVGRDHAGRRPDLLVNEPQAGVFVEGTVALGDGAVRRDQRARADQLYAASERIRNRDARIMETAEGPSRLGLQGRPGPELVSTWKAATPTVADAHCDASRPSHLHTASEDQARVEDLLRRIHRAARQSDLRSCLGTFA
jgi:hypothetical protein